MSPTPTRHTAGAVTHTDEGPEARCPSPSMLLNAWRRQMILAPAHARPLDSPREGHANSLFRLA
jgi:hypothetical protein